LFLAESKAGRNKEVSKAFGHAALAEVALQALHHLLVLKHLRASWRRAGSSGAGGG